MHSFIRVGFVMPGARGVRGRGPSRRALAEAEHGRGAGGDTAQPRREGARARRERRLRAHERALLRFDRVDARHRAAVQRGPPGLAERGRPKKITRELRISVTSRTDA